MNKKKITAFAMATLAACSMSSIMALADDQVTITMVESLTSPERTAILREIADNYQADHPDVTIEIVSPPLENADTKITQMLMNGSGAGNGRNRLSGMPIMKATMIFFSGSAPLLVRMANFRKLITFPITG